MSFLDPNPNRKPTVNSVALFNAFKNGHPHWMGQLPDMPLPHNIPDVHDDDDVRADEAPSDGILRDCPRPPSGACRSPSSSRCCRSCARQQPHVRSRTPRARFTARRRRDARHNVAR